MTKITKRVRRGIQDARRNTSSQDIDRKLSAIRAAASYAFPAPDIEQMNKEIEQDGDYTRERQQLFETLTLDELLDAVRSDHS